MQVFSTGAGIALAYNRRAAANDPFVGSEAHPTGIYSGEVLSYGSARCR